VSRGGWSSTTHWSLILEAGDSKDPRSSEALELLCRRYWYPVYVYIRRRGNDSAKAEDLTQGFFTQFLEKGYVKQASAERGRFRSFLLVAVKNYLANEWDREQALKRGGGTTTLSLDFETAEGRYAMEPVDPSSPADLYNRRWALTQLERTLEELQNEMQSAGLEERFEHLKGVLTGDSSGESYREIGEALQMSENAVKVTVHRMRRRFGELLRELVGETLDNPEEIDSEIRYLFSVVSG
jgi:RNA polymerase sigma-70 factor (ECF subfamily)